MNFTVLDNELAMHIYIHIIYIYIYIYIIPIYIGVKMAVPIDRPIGG